MLLRSLISYQVSSFLRRRLFPAPALQLAGGPAVGICNDDHGDDLSIWLAVPKRKVTRSKKRMKTTWQKKIPYKQNIIQDPRTGETTLLHKLPFNWKEYLPTFEYESTKRQD